MFYCGRFEESIELIKKAMRLNPYYPAFYLYTLSRSYLYLGRYEEAIELANQMVERCRKGECSPWMGLPQLAVAYKELGRDEEARDIAAKLLKIRPGHFELAKKQPWKIPELLERELELFRRAGLQRKEPLPLPDKPSIAVLPFTNMSGDPEQDYFCDGITESIITTLSKTPKLFVIARNSSFTYKGKPVKVQQVGRELGVRYVLEGSIQKSENRVRITAQLVDAKTGNHLWAERYDRDLKDIFALQDDIARNIITALRVKLTEGEHARISARGTNNHVAYIKVMRGMSHVMRFNKNDNEIARKLYEEAIAIDPNYAGAYNSIAWTYRHEATYRWTKTRAKSYEKAIQIAKKALSLDETNGSSYMVISLVSAETGEYEKAVAEAKNAIALEPNNASVNFLSGLVYHYAGRDEVAAERFEKAIKLSPINPYFHRAGCVGYFNVRDYEKAIATAKEAIRQKQYKLEEAYVILVASYSLLGRQEEARTAAEELLRSKPKFSLAGLKKYRYYLSSHTKYRANIDRLLEEARKSGLK
jgi:adenylate cyclase